MKLLILATSLTLSSCSSVMQKENCKIKIEKSSFDKKISLFPDCNTDEVVQSLKLSSRSKEVSYRCAKIKLVCKSDIKTQ